MRVTERARLGQLSARGLVHGAFHEILVLWYMNRDDKQSTVHPRDMPTAPGALLHCGQRKSLGANEITDKGGLAIAEGLAHNASLRNIKWVPKRRCRPTRCD